MKEILTALMIWLSANTFYSTDHPLPNVIFLSQAEMNALYYKDNEHEPSDLHGMYNKEEDVIILPDTWDIRNPWDQGVLLHEMVHYYQDMNEMKFDCSQEMEKDAWPIQQFYLKKVHNYDWDYDQLWYMMISTCHHEFGY